MAKRTAKHLSPGLALIFRDLGTSTFLELSPDQAL